MFERVFVERQVRDHPRTREILSQLRSKPEEIDKVESVFGRVKKPYLHKRQSLNLFIGRKRGALVKPAPDAYGLRGVPHYYFVHNYNCIFECEYCYLQGYFNSPDIVMYVNHDEICSEIRRVASEEHSNEEVWFHGGEFSDSFALSHLTREWPTYWQTFAKIPNARLELRSKSANIRSILGLPVISNVIISFSIAPETQIQQFDSKTATLVHRLSAARRLSRMGYRLGFHCDPVIYIDGFKEKYRQLVQQLFDFVNHESIEYVSLGVVRFSKDDLRAVKRNYPGSALLTQPMIVGYDGKQRYSQPLRLAMLKYVRDLFIENDLPSNRIYMCMEDESNQFLFQN